MVRFEEKKIVIEISRSYPTEYWLETMRGILSVMAIANKDLLCREEDILYNVCDFLIEILPNQEDLSEMLSKRGLKP